MLEARAQWYFDGMHLGSDDLPEPTALEARLDYYCGLIIAQKYSDAYHELRADKAVSAPDKLKIIAAVNDQYLLRRRLEWGNHGIRSTFRFWSDAQKVFYIRQANVLIAALQQITPCVTFGFGSVLGFVRDNGFIPHDDDLDVLVALPVEVSTFGAAKKILRDHLEPQGFELLGDYLSHFNVKTGKGAAVDLFIGFDEGDKVSWFPSQRGGLKPSEVFPTRAMEILGETCAVPADPERYLAVTYGEDWRQPIANWNHPWDARKYADFR